MRVEVAGLDLVLEFTYEPGGQTRAYLSMLGEPLGVGWAFLHPKDKEKGLEDRRIGEKVALEKCLESARFGRRGRGSVWRAYWASRAPCAVCGRRVRA